MKRILIIYSGFLLIICSISVLIAWSCKKGIEEDKQYIRGRLFLVDTITQSSNGVPIGGKKVLLSKPDDNLNYLYSTNTDSDGYFSFTLLSESNEDFILSTADIIKGYNYKSKLAVKRGDIDVVLIERLDDSLQNGFVLKTTDVAGEVLPKTTVYLFNNQTLAIQNNPSGAMETLTSDSLGKFFKIRIPAGVYFINATKNVDTASFQRVLKQITVPAKGFISDTMALKRTVVTHQNGFTIVVIDSLNGSIPNANVYLYNSPVLASSNSPAGVYDSFTTDGSGKKTKYDLPPGDYYININKVISDSLVYQSLTNKLTLPALGFVTDTIMVRKKQ